MRRLFVRHPRLSIEVRNKWSAESDDMMIMQYDNRHLRNIFNHAHTHTHTHSNKHT